MGKKAWRVRRGVLLVGGRGGEVVAESEVGRLLRRDSRKAWGVGKVGGCGIGEGMRQKALFRGVSMALNLHGSLILSLIALLYCLGWPIMSTCPSRCI